MRIQCFFEMHVPYERLPSAKIARAIKSTTDLDKRVLQNSYLLQVFHQVFF